VLCVWRDQKGVLYYELLKPGETVNTQRYRQQMIDLYQALCEKRPEYDQRQHKVIVLHDNAPSHTAKPVKETIETFGWEILPHGVTHQTWRLPIFTYLHPWDTHLLTGASHLTKMYENGLMTGLQNRRHSFFGLASTHCRNDGRNVSLAMANTSNKLVLSIVIQSLSFLYINSGFIFTHLALRCKRLTLRKQSRS